MQFQPEPQKALQLHSRNPIYHVSACTIQLQGRKTILNDKLLREPPQIAHFTSKTPLLRHLSHRTVAR